MAARRGGRERMTQAAGMVTVRQAVIELLRSLGMTTVFGNPG